jgi:hemerythrin-like metal-binding protein
MSSGSATIDAEHQSLFAAVEAVGASIEMRDFAHSAELVDRFVATAMQHFDNEEALLRRAEYPNLDGHIAFHRSLLTSAGRLRQVCATASQTHQAEGCYSATVAFLLDDVVRGDHEFKSYLQTIGKVK